MPPSNAYVTIVVRYVLLIVVIAIILAMFNINFLIILQVEENSSFLPGRDPTYAPTQGQGIVTVTPTSGTGNIPSILQTALPPILNGLAPVVPNNLPLLDFLND